MSIAFIFLFFAELPSNSPAGAQSLYYTSNQDHFLQCNGMEMPGSYGDQGTVCHISKLDSQANAMKVNASTCCGASTNNTM